MMPDAARAIVCVVDDDPDIRESLRFLFEEAGFEVEEAEDGGAALALLHAKPHPRVLLLDHMMPRLDGIQTLRLLGDDPELSRRTAVLFMTARSDTSQPEIATLLHAQTCATITKPFDLDALLAAVERASSLQTARVTHPS